jgi:hypothetical protein
MQEISYQYPRFERLQPRSEWRGGRLADTDLLTLEEAAGFASKHAGEEITARDFLRAAGRGEITLRAIVYRAAKVRKHDGGVLFNKGEPNENIVPAGAIPTLPLSACQHLANAGRARWRTFDGFEERNGILMRYTKGMLHDDEPDFETVPDDCRVVGYDVHALADEYCAPEDAPQAATPAPVADSASNAPMTPPPVATGDVAHAFDGLRRWNEKAWKDTLGSPPKWLEACIALRGQRGIREHHWNPVLIGAALVHSGHAKANNIRARFQTKPQLSAWLEAWKTYEADNFDTQ